ncbi:ABC transporter permease [Streptacidiphilus carbonis]|uniref:ABC transporter permease n=1 Tax=Streptacidiphilus carbonis TaxID=105422 RepID=UPI0005AA9AD2|nr:ABC transporter permease [Streptacidiphilus carbonis]
MSAVWRASRGAVKRRRLQTIVIGLVVMCSTTAILCALGVLDAASAPFDKAYSQQRGAHVVATFDTTKTSDQQLALTALRPGVHAAAGPFDEAVLTFSKDFLGSPPGALTVVGRSAPSGPVDDLTLQVGRWATAPGEVVLDKTCGQAAHCPLGSTLQADGAPPLKVVGLATSVSRSADAWVAPEQMAALHPTSAQMLYRFTDSATDAQLRTSLDQATAGLPPGALKASQSYLTLKQAFSALADSYLPFMTLFGILSLLVSVLIVGNVVSGAVVSGYRHIGVLKAVGFTPNQVVAVYLAMVSVPAIAGSALGTLLGSALAQPMLGIVFHGVETGGATPAISPWLPVVSLAGMPLIVALAALIPALRAHRLPAARAITAGSAPRAGRGLRVQRWLGATRLPRSISLGLAQPFARPARALMTAAAIVLGVATVTLTTGLSSTMVAYADAGPGTPQIDIQTGSAAAGQTLPKLSDAQDEAMLHSLPGVRQFAANASLVVHIVGYTQPTTAFFFRGDPPAASYQIVKGHWLDGPGQAVVGPMFLNQHGLAVGDRITLELNGHSADMTIVGQTVDGDARGLNASWPTLADLAPDRRASAYTLQLAPGTDTREVLNAIRAADPGLYAASASPPVGPTVAVVSFSSAFTVLLTIVAALGVFNTVLLNTRERRRDLGMLKAIGMTPRQVTAMTVTSVTALGLVSGLVGIPVGILAHRMIVDHVGVVEFTESMKDVWHPPQLAALALSGAAIAVLGALIPARSAARLTSAAVLHNE